MSSAVLFLAIVAIWAFVLVPRWMRRQHAAPQPRYEADDMTGSADYEEFGYGPQHEAPDYDTDLSSADADLYGADTDFYAAAEPDATPMPSQPAEPASTAGARQHARTQPAAPPSRSRVLQARRRLLTLLVLLAAAAGTCTALKLTAWWICIPPAVMLGMYLLLLREAAIADAEQAYWRAAELRAQADRERAYQAQASQAPAEEATAEVIDISGRVGDMLYDQYADATVRAVGD